MKKILSAVFAAALGLALAVPAASACPGKDKVAKEDQSQIAQKDEAKKEAPKTAEKQKKEPVQVSKK